MLALLLSRAAKLGTISSAVATVLEPVSESGHPGMDELHQQTVKLLSFQPLPKEVFDTQVAFNLIQSYGSARSASLERTRQRIHDHLKRIAPAVKPPALMLVGAPVFHAHTMSLFVELDEAATIERWRDALAGPHIHLVGNGAENEGPSNISAAGEAAIQLTVASDPTHTKGVWIWAAADNLKMTANTAVACARTLVEMRPAGPVQ
jgi:aspartate-semialdehyde dehydrogenase